MSDITLKACPICGKEDWKGVKDMIDHVDHHNRADPEFEKSMKKEMERRKKQVFG